MSLSLCSLTASMVWPALKSWMKTEGLRLSSEAGSLSPCRIGPCAGGEQFSGTGGEPLRLGVDPGAGGQPGVGLIVVGD